MCLMFPLGGGGGECDQCCQPMFPPTPKAREHKNVLMIIAFIHLFLALGLMFSNMSVYWELITVMMLFCTTMNYNPCCLVMYIFYALIDLFTYVDLVGLYF